MAPPGTLGSKGPRGETLEFYFERIQLAAQRLGGEPSALLLVRELFGDFPLDCQTSAFEFPSGIHRIVVSRLAATHGGGASDIRLHTHVVATHFKLFLPPVMAGAMFVGAAVPSVRLRICGVCPLGRLVLFVRPRHCIRTGTNFPAALLLGAGVGRNGFRDYPLGFLADAG